MLPRFTLGDTLTYRTVIDGRSAADGWVMTLRLVLRSGTGAITVTGAADTEDPTAHRITATAATTAAWAAGTFSWHEWVEKAGAKHAVASGSAVLVADPRTATGTLDIRTPAAVALDAVRALLQGKATTGQAQYSINNRSLQSYSITELIALEDKLARDVARENNAAAMLAGRPTSRRIMVRTARA